MNETMDKKTFAYETYYDQKLSFEIDDTHFKYRLDDGEQLIATWNDIQSLEINRFGNTLEIHIDHQPKSVTVPFGTDNFLEFLEEISSRIGRTHAQKIDQKDGYFTVSRLFYTMMAFFLSAPIILLIALLMNFSSVLDMESFSAFVALIVPTALIFYSVCIFIKAGVKKDRLILKGLLRKSVYAYTDIKSIGFELMDLKKRGSLLVVAIILGNGKKIRVKWLKDLMQFFIVLRYKWQTFQNTRD